MVVTLPQWVVDFSAMLTLLLPIVVVTVGVPLGIEFVHEIIDLLTGGFWR